MDNKRFDTLVKQLAIGADRRRILKGLFGGAAAAVAGGLTRQDTAATLICKYDADCDEKKKCEVCKYGKCEPKCDPKKCEVCDGYGNCKSTCDPKKCEECKDGYCKVTCRPDEVCDYGKCKPKFCGHSVGPNGGCKGACSSAGFTGNQCNPICGNGQFRGFCPVGQGGDNPCCNAGLCDPKNFKLVGGVVTYVGPTAGC
jgi:hypothetical protein